MKHQILLSFKNMIVADDETIFEPSVDFNKKFKSLKLDKSGKDALDS